MQDAAPRPAERVISRASSAGTHWSGRSLATSRGEIPIRLSEGKRLSIILLGRTCNSGDSIELLDRLSEHYELIEIGLPASRTSGAGPLLMEAIPAHADLVVEVLEKLGIEFVVALDWTFDGQLGRELIAVLPGLAGMAVVSAGTTPTGAAVQNTDFDASETGTAISYLSTVDEHALDGFLADMETKVAELSTSPPLWYGG